VKSSNKKYYFIGLFIAAITLLVVSFYNNGFQNVNPFSPKVQVGVVAEDANVDMTAKQSKEVPHFNLLGIINKFIPH